MASAVQAGPLSSTTSMGLMTSLYAQLAAANPVPQGMPLATPLQLREHMERLRGMRAEVLQRTVRTQKQLEQGYLARKLALQDALQRSLTELDHESRQAEEQLEWHANNGAIALMATGAASAAAAVAEVASRPHLAPTASAAVTEAISRPHPAPSVIIRPAAPPAAAAEAQPAAAPAAASEPAAEPQSAEALTAAGEDLASEQLASTPFYAPHLAAVGLAHIASATPPLVAAANVSEIEATPAAGAPAPLAAVPASDDAAATATAEAAAEAAFAAAAEAAFAVAVASSERAAMQQPVLSDAAVVQSPGAPPKPPAMAKRQRSGPVVRQLSLQPRKASPPQQATPEATAPTGAAAPHAAAGPSAEAKQPATELGAEASRNKRMDLLASAAVSQSSLAQQQSPQPTRSAAISPAGAAAALLSLQPETEEANARAPAASHEQPVAVPAAAGGTALASAKAAGAAEGRAGASTASADPAAEAGARAARSSQPDVIDLAGTSDTDSPAPGGASTTGHDADSGATYADARSSGSWRVGHGDGESAQLENVPQPAGQARSSKHGSQRRKNRKRKAAGGNGASTLQHAGGGVPSRGDSIGQQPHMAAESAWAAADSQQPAAANWTSVKSFWHVPPGKTKPVKVKDVNALARETHNQAVAADFVQLADARQQLAVEHDSLEGAAGDARQDDVAMPLAAKVTLPRRSGRRRAGGRSMVPEAAGGATAGGSSVHSGSKRSASQAAGAQPNADTGPATRKRVRRDAEKLQEAAAATAAAAQPSMQPALGFDPQVVTRQSSQELLPDAAIAAHSKLQGAASSASPGADAPSPPRCQRAAAAQAAAVTQAMLQPLRPAAKPAAKGDTKPGKATSGRVQASRAAVTGVALQPSPPVAAAAGASPTAGQGATSTANGAAGRDPAAMGSKPGDSFHVFRLPRVRPKASVRHFPAAIFTAAGLEPPQPANPASAAEGPGRSADAGAAMADMVVTTRPPQRMCSNLPDLRWPLNREPIIRRAWNDSANVSRQIPKSWDEALAHPTLRSLALRSSRRYSVRSIVGLRGGAGSAWLLHTLFGEFGVESKVADVQQAAPKRHWRPASSASRAASQQQPQRQPAQQPDQPLQQQQPGQHLGSGTPRRSEPSTPEQSGSERGPQENGGGSAEPAAEEASGAPNGPSGVTAAPAADAAAAAAPDVTGTPAGDVPPSPAEASRAPAAAADADVEPAAAEIAVAGAAGVAAERGQPPVQQDAALEATLPAAAEGPPAADGPAASVQHQPQPAELVPDKMAAQPDAAGDGSTLTQRQLPQGPPQLDEMMVDAPPTTPSEQQQQQQQSDAAPAEAAAPDASIGASALLAASEQQPPESIVGMLTDVELGSLQGLDTSHDGAAASATVQTLAAAVDAVAEAVQPPDAAAVSTSSAPAVEQDPSFDSAAAAAAAAAAGLPGGKAAAPPTEGTQQQPGDDVTAEPAVRPQLQDGTTAGHAAEPAQREEPLADVQPALHATPQCSGAEQLPIADLIEQLLPPAAARGSSAETNQRTGAPADASVELTSGGDEAPVAVQSRGLVEVQQSKTLIPHVPQLF